MRQSVPIFLTAGVAAALLACGRRGPDPCASATFDQFACQEAVSRGGYYWQGSWIPMGYSHPYPYYFDTYSSYRRSGGMATPAPAGAYARPAGASGPGKTFGTGSGSGSGASSGTVRGGFGGAAAGHGGGGE